MTENDASAGLPGRFARWQREKVPRWFPWVAFVFGVLYFTIRHDQSRDRRGCHRGRVSAGLLGFGLGSLAANLLARRR